MPELIYPQNTIAVLKKHHFQFQKRYGQNFLIDPQVLERIIRAAEIGPDDFVLEIGPGIGTMTQALCEAARSVTAVEIDRNLIPILGETLDGYHNVTVLQEDVLDMDIRQLAEEKNGGKPIKIVANLPYYITTPIVLKLLESEVPLQSITIMVQREVAERMCAAPGTKDYGALTLAIRYYTEPEIRCFVPPNCFMPRPKVGSAVVRLTRHETPSVETKDVPQLFKLIRASFNQRRKTLQNGIANSPDFSLSREEIASCIASCGFSPTVRGETLTLEEFARLSDAITAYMDR